MIPKNVLHIETVKDGHHYGKNVGTEISLVKV